MRQPPIKVFEYQTLYVKGYRDGPLTNKQFDVLVKYNQANDSRYFTVVHRGIKFKQYVGVIQVGGLTIEILPKADKKSFQEANKEDWKRVLLDMLRACRLIKINESTRANLYLRNRSLLDLYIENFLTEVEELAHRGLIKSYRQTQSNRKVLAGQINFAKQINKNLIHKERFYLKHQTYDRNHLLHQILHEAILIIPQVSQNPDFSNWIKDLLSYFQNFTRKKITQSAFDAIVYHRKTAHYKTAIELAKMLLLNFNPDIKEGCNNVLSILFDMNVLFEEYIFRKIKKEAPEGFTVSRQAKKNFWESQTVRPDILIQKGVEAFVIDTKWKVLNLGAQKTFLVYPEVYYLGSRVGRFHVPKSDQLDCELKFLSVLDEHGRLNNRVGEMVWQWF